MREIVTGDDSAYCGICGKETSIAMIARHLEDAHGIDPEDIANAPIIDSTTEEDDRGNQAGS